MDEMTAFERQVAGSLQHMAGPGRRIDAMAMARTAASRSPRWRVPSMFSATRLVVAGAIVAFFAGLLMAGVSPTWPERQAAPGAATTAAPSPTTSPSPSVTPDASAAAVASGQVRFEARAKLVVDPGPNPSGEDLALAEAALVRYAAMTEAQDVTEAVIEQLGLDESTESLLGRISAETTGETLELTLRVSDDDPEAARALAQALGDELRQRVYGMVITDEVRQAERAIAASRAALRASQARLDHLVRTRDKTQRDRRELVALTGQISSLQQQILVFQTSSRAQVRNRLVWLVEPTVVERSEAGVGQEAAIPTTDVVVASRRIEQGTTISPDMLTRAAVPTDATNEMAFTDTGSAVGKVAAIDILADQPITANMLVAE